MSTVKELFHQRREVVDETIDVPYMIHNAADEAEVRTAAYANIPSSVTSRNRTLILDSVEIEERINEITWRVLARYNRYSPSTLPDSQYAFDTGGGTQHITQSISTVAKHGPKASTKLGGAIGYDGKNVRGVDITVPTFNFAEKHYFADADVTSAYKQTLFGLTGRYNNASFKGFDAGEVLFMGASGRRQGDDSDDLWEIMFRFAAQENRTGLSVGDITGIDKKGWEYLWVQYGDVADDATEQLVKEPVAVYIEKVYYAGDFSQLDIGT